MALSNRVCRHLDPRTDCCTVYAERPLVCRIDDVFHQRLEGVVPARVFYLLQARSCATLDARNAHLPRMMAEQLVDEACAGPHEGSDVLLSRESRVAAALTVDPDQVETGMRHILEVAKELMLQGVDPDAGRSNRSYSG
jgi:hypothetical protein